MKQPIAIMTIAILISVMACKDKTATGTFTPVPGTRVSIQLPDGFFASPGNGFRHHTYKAGILVMSVPLPYKTALLDLTAEKLAAAQQTLKTAEDVTVDGVQGTLCKVYYSAQGSNFGQWRLVLPEDQNIVTVSGTFAVDHEKDVADKLKHALLTLKMDQAARPDPAVVGFTIAPTDDMKLAKVLEGPSAVYTLDGAWTHASLFTYSLMCSTAPRMDTLVAMPTVAMDAFRQVCPACDVEQQDSLTVDGLPVQEMWGTDGDSTARLKYQAVIADKSAYYFIVGTADEAHRDRLDDFRSVVRTWKKKAKKGTSI